MDISKLNVLDLEKLLAQTDDESRLAEIVNQIAIQKGDWHRKQFVMPNPQPNMVAAYDCSSSVVLPP